MNIPHELRCASQRAFARNDNLRQCARNPRERYSSVNTVLKSLRGYVAIGLSLCIAACSGSGSVNVGSGQAADPGTVDFPIAYVKRTIPTPQDDLDDIRAVRDTAPDADLFVRDRASPSSVEKNVTERITGTTDRYDIKDVDVSSDGKKFVFAMRGPLAMNQDEKDPPSWAIWEYDIAADTLHRVIASNTIASEGHDVAPQYLPDGRILFSSTRQRQSQAILRDEGRPGYEAQTDDRSESAFVLHVMKADGTDIHQISFNQSHDLSPSVLADGRVMYSRWDGASGRGIHLYTANPDGTNMQLLYGARSHNTGTINPATNQPATIQFTRAREMQNGRVLALTRPFADVDFGGDLSIIDVRTYVENTQPLAVNAGLVGPAQTRGTPNEVRNIAGPSPGGRFRSAYPLWDGSNRILVSWSQCRLMDNTVTPAAIVPCTPDRLSAAAPELAPALYSAFIFDPADNTFKPLFQPVESVMITDLVAAQPRTPPGVILDKVAVIDFEPILQTEAVGILDIRSVYDFDGTDRAATAATPGATIATLAQSAAANRRARFIRIEKPVSMGDDDLGFPDLDNAAFGTVNFMREILAYAPIEPDGSVQIRVPANVAFVISILDADGRRIPEFRGHRNWLQLRPGETRRCNGCHLPAAGNAMDRSHGRDGTSVSVWTGAMGAGPFPGTEVRFRPNAGETMAQVRARTTCGAGSTQATCSQYPRVNVVYTDEWTEPATAMRAKDAAFDFSYTNLTTTAPVDTACNTTWASTCRVIINYRTHIHPLWSVDRLANTCTNCHNRVDAANANAPRVPAGQLELTDGDSQQQPLHFNAYRELLFANDELELFGGAVRPTIVIDPVTGIQQPTPQVQPSLAAGNARGSNRFFCKFAQVMVPPCNNNHVGWLTPAELRLLSEWVDIGAQYFNNPFDPLVPLN
jgi:hypothetical protein